MMDAGKICWPGWETVQLIGRGSFGAVYEIRRDVLGETERAALKVISIPQSSSEIEEMYDDGYDDESITSTFESHLKSIVAEYSLMRKLSDCVNIVKCDDVRYVQQEDGIGWDIFIKMELLTPLAKALPADIEEKTIIKIGRDLCNALDMCKKHDVIHRDIKPQNIFVSDNGDYKLGDFGIAKTVERTVSGTKIGTYKYMAPEVYNNQPYGVAADIYSLGLVLYWMLNDRRLPFLPSGATKLTAGMEDEARSRRFSGEPIPEPAHGSAGLKAIVLRACAFDPAVRFSTPRQMYEALEELTESPRRPTPPPKGDLDIRGSAILTKAEAAAGCTKTVQVAPNKALNVSFPAGVRNGAVIRLAGAGNLDAVTGKTGNALITVMVLPNPKPVVPPSPPGPQKQDVKHAGVITTSKARNGGSHKFKFKDGKSKTVQIPAGCKDGQVVDGVRVYVHDFSTKTKNMQDLPDAVLEMYAAKSSGLIGGILFAFAFWTIFGVSTMLIPVMAVGINVHFWFAFIRGLMRKQTIDQAKHTLKARQLRQQKQL